MRRRIYYSTEQRVFRAVVDGAFIFLALLSFSIGLSNKHSYVTYCTGKD